jgi:hypothetical protein
VAFSPIIPHHELPIETASLVASDLGMAQSGPHVQANLESGFSQTFKDGTKNLDTGLGLCERGKVPAEVPVVAAKKDDLLNMMLPAIIN